MSWVEALFSSRTIAPVHGDRYGMISMLDRSEKSNGVMSGIITTFVKLDGRGDWFNADQMKEATETQISEINIPANLYPNAATFYFYFNGGTHKMYFQTYSKGKTLTPQSALRFFSSLSRNMDIISKFNEAKISIVQSKSDLERMFSIKRIKEIEITIMKPSTDVFDDEFEKNIEKNLEDT